MAAEPLVALVQARMGSSRFPGKSLAPFAGTTVVGRVLERLTGVERPLELAVATSTEPEDDELARACERLGVHVVRGARDDVLGRFADALVQLGRTDALVIRICADRPLLCPRLVEEAVDLWGEDEGVDYLANNLEPSYPDGLDVELVRGRCLLAAARESEDPYEREHVTPFIYRRPQRFRRRSVTCPYGNYAHVRVALDTPEDHVRLLEVHDLLAEREQLYDYRDVLNLAELRPDLLSP